MDTAPSPSSSSSALTRSRATNKHITKRKGEWKLNVSVCVPTLNKMHDAKCLTCANMNALCGKLGYQWILLYIFLLYWLFSYYCCCCCRCCSDDKIKFYSLIFLRERHLARFGDCTATITIFPFFWFATNLVALYFSAAIKLPQQPYECVFVKHNLRCNRCPFFVTIKSHRLRQKKNESRVRVNSFVRTILIQLLKSTRCDWIERFKNFFWTFSPNITSQRFLMK